MEKDVAISVQNISKTFKIPHEKTSTLRGAAISLLKKKSYEEFKALDDVSFEIKKGEFFGVIGRNGSGKSTLLKILAGIYQPDKGKIKIQGRISPFLELGIGFNPELSGRDNVYLNGTVLGLTKKEIDEKFHSIVKFSELERFIDQKLKNYSSGMQVRLAFSVSIHANREILLMDEVLAVGDLNFQSKCLTEFNRYKKNDKTVILVTHDISTVQKYCDRAMLIRDGKIIKIGSANEVGQEYVEQNILDEEKRLNEEKKSQNLSLKNKTSAILKSAEITKVIFLNDAEEEKNVFETGDNITARIYYRANEEIIKPVFGIAIHTQEGIYIAGPNTKTSEFVLQKINGNGFVDFKIIKNNFFSETFNFTVVIADWDNTKAYDIKNQQYFFKVFSKDENQNGIIKLEHQWNV